jgi:hypothetical protein
VYHARSVFNVLASIGADGATRIAVSDPVRHPPRMRSAHPTASDGRGLAIVEALADRWGVEPLGSGKTVWAELCPLTGSSTGGRTVSRPRPGAPCPPSRGPAA